LDHLEWLYPQAPFTTVYVVVDNYGIHKAKAVERWLAAPPRWQEPGIISLAIFFGRIRPPAHSPRLSLIPPVRAQRHPAHGVTIGRLMAHLMRRGRRLDHTVRQPPQARDLDFDEIPHVHRARVPGGARHNHIPGQQGDKAAEVRQDIIDGEDHFRDRSLLRDSAVDVSGSCGVGDAHAGDDARSDRADPVLAFDAKQRAGVRVTKVLAADIVAGREAGDILPRPLTADVAHRLADNHRHFPFVIEI